MLALLMPVSAPALEIPAHEPGDPATTTYFAGAENTECRGRPAALYFNAADPEGSLNGFQAAARENAQWLVDKGYDTVTLQTFTGRTSDGEIVFGNLIVYPDQATYQQTRDNRATDRDAAFEAFTGQYAANTRDYQRLLLCLAP